jgi:hypothetical protein
MDVNLICAQNGNLVFQAGEKLKYLMHYGWIDGGTASLTLRETEFNGKKVYHSKAVGESMGLTDRIYNVHDIYESYFDKETLLPLKAIRSIEEGKYRSYNEVVYHHEKKSLESLKSGKHFFPDSMPSKVFDLVSAFYHIRKSNYSKIKPGELITVNTYFPDEFWLLQVKYVGEETIKTRIGKFVCMEFRPVVEPGRVFNTQDDVKIFISKDKNYVPIRVQMDLFVGSFKCDLIEFSGLKYDLDFTKR